MGFNSAFKGLKLLKNPGNRRLNNLNDPVLSVLIKIVLQNAFRLNVTNNELMSMHPSRLAEPSKI